MPILGSVPFFPGFPGVSCSFYRHSTGCIFPFWREPPESHYFGKVKGEEGVGLRGRGDNTVHFPFLLNCPSKLSCTNRNNWKPFLEFLSQRQGHGNAAREFTSVAAAWVANALPAPTLLQVSTIVIPTHRGEKRGVGKARDLIQGTGP